MDVILYVKGEYFKTRPRRNLLRFILRTIFQTVFIIFAIFEVSHGGEGCRIPGIRYVDFHVMVCFWGCVDFSVNDFIVKLHIVFMFTIRLLVLS